MEKSVLATAPEKLGGKSLLRPANRLLVQEDIPKLLKVTTSVFLQRKMKMKDYLKYFENCECNPNLIIYAGSDMQILALK
jgi:hypothetical protein